MSAASTGMRRRAPAGAPRLDLDLYSREAIEDSRECFAAIRDAGPAVWLTRHRMWAMGRFEDVRAALRDDEAFISGEGVAANPITNRSARSTTLFSDGEVHERRRRVLMRSLGARALTPIQEQLDEQAEALIEELIGAGEFDAAGDFASRLPLRVVADLVGLEAETEELLRWGGASFDVLGPLNGRTVAASRASTGFLLTVFLLRRSRVRPGSWAASVFDAAERGEISGWEARNMVIDFVAPSLDTTILASTYMLWLLGRNPEAWRELRADPSLIPAAVVESVRLGSPIRGFTRRLARDREVGGTTMRAGSRVVLLFGAANLDERRFADPERFDLHREDGGHMGWGNGPHTCVGIHLSKLEMQAQLRAMAPRVEDIGVGTPAPLLNNTLQGIARLPATLS